MDLVSTAMNRMALAIGLVAPNSNANTDTTDTQNTSEPSTKKSGSNSDTQRAAAILTALILSTKLPCDLIPQILDDASFYQILATTHPHPIPFPFRTKFQSSEAQRITSQQSPRQHTRLTLPDHLPRGVVRRITFTVVSKDQGWSDYPLDHGSYRGSWTWFEVGVTGLDPEPESESDGGDEGEDEGEDEGGEGNSTRRRRASARRRRRSSAFVTDTTEFDMQQQQHHHHHHQNNNSNGNTTNPTSPTTSTPTSTRSPPLRRPPPPPQQYKYGTQHLVTNIHAGRDYTTHTIEWSLESHSATTRKIIRELKGGCGVDVVAWAKYPGWCNYVRGVKIEVEGVVVRRM